LAIPWNEDDPRDAPLIVKNITDLLRQIGRRARLRQSPTIEMAQAWHRQIYKGARLPVNYYAGYAHGEWVRIHPFANGNGRTARLWANWCALRYGVPPFVRLKPRPAGDLYPTASALSMQGDHQAMVAVFADMLDRHLGGD
jgi:hypothetical protein